MSIEHWQKHVADDRVVILPRGPMTKGDRWSGIEKREQEPFAAALD